MRRRPFIEANGPCETFNTYGVDIDSWGQIPTVPARHADTHGSGEKSIVFGGIMRNRRRKGAARIPQTTG